MIAVAGLATVLLVSWVASRWLDNYCDHVYREV